MTRQQFRLLVVVNQILLFAYYPVGDLTDSLLPPELAGQFGMDASVMEGHGGGSFSDDPLYLLSLGLSLLTLVAAVGLFFAKRWGRTLYLFALAAGLVLTASTPFYVNTGWTVAFGALYGTTEGMILGLVYFSHLRRMFERRGTEGDDDADAEE